MSKAAKIDAITLKPSECAAAIRAMSRTKKRAMFLWGPPGISKSETAEGVATSEGIAFIDLRLSQMEPTDLRGIPRPALIDGVEGVIWSPPYILPKDLDISLLVDVPTPEPVEVRFSNPIGKNGIHYCTSPKIEVRPVGNREATAEIVARAPDRVTVVLKDQNGEPITGKLRVKVTGKVRAILALEEFNSAPQSVQAAAYQFVNDRRIGEYIVPEGVWIMGMGNRDTDRGVTYKMPTPIMNRFVHIEMKTDFDDWQMWALGARIHPEVIGYLTSFKQELFEFNAGTAARGFATPRSWHFVSDILHANEDMPASVEMGLICGAVGDGIGVKFVEFRKVAADLPKASSILDGSLKKMPKKVEVQLAYALTTTLCYELAERAEKVRAEGGANWNSTPARQKWLEEADNFIGFMMENFQPEICIMGARIGITIHRLPFETKKMKNFDHFAAKYKSLIVA